jgi:hypothetical protein
MNGRKKKVTIKKSNTSNMVYKEEKTINQKEGRLEWLILARISTDTIQYAVA